MPASAQVERSHVCNRSGKVAVCMQDAPDINMVVVADVEHQVRETVQRPAPKFRNVQLESESERACQWVLAEVVERLLQ